MQKDILNYLLKIIESPFAKKSYQDLEEFYRKSGMTIEADALQHLIQSKFDNNHNINN